MGEKEITHLGSMHRSKQTKTADGHILTTDYQEMRMHVENMVRKFEGK